MRSFTVPPQISVCHRMRKSLRVLGASAWLLLICPPAFSQINLGRIFGTITDQSGGVIAGASVVVTDVARGVSRSLTTDNAGEYSAPSLIPGTYTVRATSQGFRTIERQNVVLGVGQDARVDLAMQPGEQTQTLTVTESLPIVDTTSATLGGAISNQAINDLPLNGRNFQNLITLRPGVMIYPGGGAWTQSTNGLRAAATVYMVDGLMNMDPNLGGTVINAPSAISEGAIILPIDALQEFTVEENPKAEFGWKAGAVVNVGIKSGTNSVHGSAYAYGRTDAWDARNYFNFGPNTEPSFCASNPASCAKLPLYLEQFGGTVGGRIVKDKLFYFLGYEGLRSSIGNVFGLTVPETCDRSASSNCGPVDTTNNIADASAALQNAGIPISAVSQKLLPLFPPNNSSSNSETFGFPNTNQSDNGVAKIDYHINDRHTLSGMLFIGNYTGVGEGRAYVNSKFLDVLPTRSWVNNESWIWTPNSRWVNQARFGFNRLHNPLLEQDASTPATAFGINTGVTFPGGLPTINLGAFTPLGTSFARPIFQGSTLYDGLDTLSYLRGDHALKFGVEIAHSMVPLQNYVGGRGLIFFLGGSTFAQSTPLEDFLSGNPSFAFLLVGNPRRDLSEWSYAGFAEDDWRVSPRLTLNLGLRYEYFTPPSEAHNLLGNFDPNVGLVQVGEQISSPFHPDRKNFSPRFGLAWDPTGKGTTSIRVGASIMYDHPPLSLYVNQFALQNAPTAGLGVIPTGATGVAPGGGTIATGTVAVVPTSTDWNTQVFSPSAVGSIHCGTANGTQCNILAMDQNFRYALTENWTVDIQHRFTSTLGLDVAYVGNHGRNLPLIRDINQIDPATGTGPYSAKFPFLGFINYLSSTGWSNYNGLQVTVDQKVSHGLSILAGYTYAHALDDGSLDLFALLPQDSRHPELEYASSDFDIRHRFTLTITYSLPSKKSPLQLLEGWQINSIATLQSGQPWLADDLSSNFSGTFELADRWDYFGNPADFKSGPIGLPHCSGAFETPGAVSCVQFPAFGIGQPTPLSASATASAQQACLAHARSVTTLDKGGCYVKGNSVMVPPAANTFGTMGRNIFRDSGFRNWDLSVMKNFKYRERFNAQFRAEFFNVLNHPNFANPYGGVNGFGFVGPVSPGNPGSNGFGCGCATPDVAAGNPIVGSGANRAIQLGLKLIF